MNLLTNNGGKWLYFYIQECVQEETLEESRRLGMLHGEAKTHLLYKNYYKKRVHILYAKTTVILYFMMEIEKLYGKLEQPEKDLNDEVV